MNSAGGRLATERDRKAFLNTAALVRTAFSSERSLLASIRTSASLFSFGFAISKFFGYLEGQQGVEFPAGPRYLGLALAALGVLVLGLAVFEHASRLRRMEELGLPTVSWLSLPIAMASGLLAIGAAVLISIGIQGPL